MIRIISCWANTNVEDLPYAFVLTHKITKCKNKRYRVSNIIIKGKSYNLKPKDKTL